MTKIVIKFTTILSNYDDLDLTELEIGGKILDFHREVEELVDIVTDGLKQEFVGDIHNVATSIVPGDTQFTVTITFDTSAAQTVDDITALINDLTCEGVSTHVCGEEAVMAYGVEPEYIAERVYGDADAARNFELIADTLIPVIIQLKLVNITVETA